MMSSLSPIAGRVLLVAAVGMPLSCPVVAFGQSSSAAKSPVQRELDALYRKRGMQAPPMSPRAAQQEVDARVRLKQTREQLAREARAKSAAPKTVPKTAPKTPSAGSLKSIKPASATTTKKPVESPRTLAAPKATVVPSKAPATRPVTSSRPTSRATWRWKRNSNPSPAPRPAPVAKKDAEKKPSPWRRFVNFVRRDKDDEKKPAAPKPATIAKKPTAPATPTKPSATRTPPRRPVTTPLPSPGTIARQPTRRPTTRPAPPRPGAPEASRRPIAGVKPTPRPRPKAPTIAKKPGDLGNPFPAMSEQEADKPEKNPFTGLALDDPAPKKPVAAQPKPKAPAGPKVDPRQLAIQARKGHGLKGFCPVVLRDQRKLVDSSNEFTARYKGATYRLSSAAARERFLSAPAKYAPIAGGNDVLLLTVEGREVPGSLDNAVWYKDRLHLFSSRATLAKFVTTLDDKPLVEQTSNEQDEPGVIRIEPRKLPSFEAKPKTPTFEPPKVGEEGSPFDEPSPFEVLED